MTQTNSLRRFRILVAGGGKARTNDNSGGPDLEEDKSPYTVG